MNKKKKMRKNNKEKILTEAKNLRKSGILLSVSSLPSEFGIGTMGKGAFEFVDFLSSAGQYYWQILPINPPGFGNSPYQAHSAFAGNVFLIDPALLEEDGLLSKGEKALLFSENTGRVDYSKFDASRLKILKGAAERVDENDVKFKSFALKNAYWLDDYCEYMAMKEKNKMRGLFDWENIDGFCDEREELIQKKLQFLFFTQWESLKAYANRNSVHIIGDIPIYVSHDSADFFAHRELFLVDEWGKPSELSGCPPDFFAKEGQLWGNPIYNWQKMEESGFDWWKERFSLSQRMFDAVRIDHFRGFYEYYSVPSGSLNAVNGKWKKGPGLSFVEKIKGEFPNLKIIAEDLGFLTDDTRSFFKESGFPGMKILQFAFGEKNSEYLPHNFPKNCVAYTGTHDNPTVVEWICSVKKSELSFAMDYLGAKNVSLLSDFFIRAVLSSVAETAIIPIQDWLKKGKDGRMNTPSTVKNNWEFRILKDELSASLSKKILYYTNLFGRNQPMEEEK